MIMPPEKPIIVVNSVWRILGQSAGIWTTRVVMIWLGRGSTMALT